MPQIQSPETDHFPRSSLVLGLTRVSGHSFIPSLLLARPVVLDLGGNHGEFAGEMARRFSAVVTSVEPNPALFDALHRRPDLRAIHAAATGTDGTVHLQVAANDQASTIMAATTTSGGTVAVPGMSLASLLSHIESARVDLVKVDIEGAEIDLLTQADGETLARIGQMSIEFHESHGLHTVGDIQRVLTRLRSLGFISFKMSQRHWGDVLCINQRLAPLTLPQQWILRYLTRNLAVLGRAVS